MPKKPMSKNQDLDILAKTFNSLSKEEKEMLLDQISDKKEEEKVTKEVFHNKFFDMNLDDEDKNMRVASKKLNKGIKKSSPRRQAVKIIDVVCGNCGKSYRIPENYPGGTENFICCV